jgi:Uma2 family endonuclease
MTVSAPQSKTYSADEYLALELESQIRNEYRNGEIVPMTGGTPAHNEIIRMLVFVLTAELRKQPYSIFVTDQRLWIPEGDLYTYPDSMITPRPAELKPGRKDTVMNPIAIAEVLSESTEGYDRGGKFAAYRTIPTFQDYVLIDQYKPHVEHYVKQSENQWLFTEYRSLDQSFTLQSIPVNLTLADLYEAVFSQ